MDEALAGVQTPCFVVDEAALKRNVAILKSVRQRTGCRILLALKGFSMFRVFPLLREGLDGTCASSPHEARLGREEFGGEVHLFAAGYSDCDMQAITEYCDHASFNSFPQWQRFKPYLSQAQRPLQCGLRINPQHSETQVALYDPCAPGSRLGILHSEFEGRPLDGITGLHVHNLCEKNADALQRTWAAVEKQFGSLIQRMQWLNLGGGHHITRADYNIELLCRLVDEIQSRYPVQVYLEPGEAVALNAGVLVASVLDVVHNDQPIVILDASATAHMPDVLEMPYRPEVAGAGRPGVLDWTCRLAGHSCLAGDVIGDYSFPRPLQRGDRVVFQDMAHYTMVKTTTFNGLQLPAIALRHEDGPIEIVRRFGYEDFKSRLS